MRGSARMGLTHPIEELRQHVLRDELVVVDGPRASHGARGLVIERLCRCAPARPLTAPSIGPLHAVKNSPRLQRQIYCNAVQYSTVQ